MRMFGYRKFRPTAPAGAPGHAGQVANQVHYGPSRPGTQAWASRNVLTYQACGALQCGHATVVETGARNM
jgi:hypothetical protein